MTKIYIRKKQSSDKRKQYYLIKTLCSKLKNDLLKMYIDMINYNIFIITLKTCFINYVGSI
jgi:hypothetical protein